MATPLLSLFFLSFKVICSHLALKRYQIEVRLYPLHINHKHTVSRIPARGS